MPGSCELNESVNANKNFISVCSLNVHGGLESKLENDDFVQGFKNNDIVFFSETWANNNSKLKLEGFSDPIVKHRLKNKKAKRDSGGICIFIKKEIRKFIKVLTWNEFEDGIVLKLDKSLFDFEHDVFLLCVYITPQSSSRNNANTDIDPFEKLTNKIAELSPLGQLILLGDLNSRTGGLSDFSLDEEDDEINLLINDDRNIVSEDLIINGMSVTRENEDKGVNDYGRKLIRLSFMSQMILLNGRCGKDKDIGRVTFCEARKNKLLKSTVDYVLCTKMLLKNICHFEINDFNVFSDHAAIHLNIVSNIKGNNQSSISNMSFTKVKWKEEKREEFVTILSNDICEIRIQEIYNTLDNMNTVTESLIDDSVSSICDIFNTAGSSHLKVYKFNEDSNMINTGRWYDKSCKDKRAIFDNFRHDYNISGLEEDRKRMCKARNEYRKFCRKKRKDYQIQEADELITLSSKNQRKFWNQFKSKRSHTGECDFHSYFKNLYESKSKPGILQEEFLYDPDFDNIIFDVSILNDIIVMEELEEAIHKLKNNKSCNIDGILNEFLKLCTSSIKKLLLKLFNVILDSGIFPTQWSRGEIIPVFKKGDINDPQNYRGITLVSSLGKLFTNILNKRLSLWAEKNSIIGKSQFGFQKDKSTIDCLFILHGLIQHFLINSKTLYCCFVDLSMAFDSVDRNALWFKLQKSGISCKIINLIKNMYSKIKLSVKSTVYSMPHNYNSRCNDTIGATSSSDATSFDFESTFTSFSGVFQGECLSPFLFSMFINDLCDDLEKVNGVGINLEEIVMTALLFADDMVIFSKTKDGLQKGLDALKKYCDMWGLEVNKEKTKCVAFKNGGKIGKLDKWSYDGKDLETVGQFKYLGLMFGSSGKFAKTFENILNQSYKALFSMTSAQYQYPEINVKTQLHLFNALVLPVLNYGSEIWGFSEADKLEKLHLGFLKNILSVRKSIPSAFIYKELGTLPLITHRFVCIFKYWLKVIS